MQKKKKKVKVEMSIERNRSYRSVILLLHFTLVSKQDPKTDELLHVRQHRIPFSD